MKKTAVPFVMAILSCLAAAPVLALGYAGMLTTSGGGIAATGDWLSQGTTSIEWEIFLNNDDSWHYEYTFRVPRHETSHFILEVSPNFTATDIFNTEGDFSSWAIGDYGPGPGNPYIPGVLHGVKFDGTSGTTTEIEFDSWRMPTWGDFYAKDGKAGDHHTFNTAWNHGFDNPDLDPTDPAADGSIDNRHILVPDTVTQPVPEPATIMLLGMGLIGVAGAHSRRRRAN